MNAATSAADAVKAIDRKPFAVIDIGSNSVRMVVYEALKRAALPVFNEKVLCGLGRGVAEHGRLDPETADIALHTLKRYAALAEAMGVGAIEAVATAAIRDSSDGPDFVARVKKTCGISVRVLSGTEEGAYSALGVAAAIPQAKGVVGDLGGGSLELVGLDDGTPGDPTTLPLGPLRFAGGTPKAAHIDKVLGQAKWLKRMRGQTLYCVGGVWRTLARVHIRQRQAPLQIIHEYRVKASDFAEFADLLAHLSPGSLAALQGVPTKRAPAVPVGALVLKRLSPPSDRRIWCSAATACGKDWSTADCPRMNNSAIRSSLFARMKRRSVRASRCTLKRSWLGWNPSSACRVPAPLRIRRAAILLSELAWRGHSDYRAEQALVRILHGPFVGVGHRGRALVALAVYERYRGDPDFVVAGEARKLLDDTEAERALTLGKLLDLGHTLSGGAPGLLPRTSLRLIGDRLIR